MKTQTLDSSQQEQFMFTQSRDPNNKKHLHIKNIVLFVIDKNNSISACFKKQRDDEYKRDAYARSKSPQKSFVQYFRSPSNDRTKRHDIRYRSRSPSRSKYNNRNTNSQRRYRSTSKTDSVMTKKLLLHNTLDHDTTTTKDIHDHIALFTDLLTDPLIDMTLVIDVDHVHIQEITTILQDTHRPINHLQDHEILDILDHVHIQIQEINLIQYNHNIKRTQLPLKYTCTTQLRRQLLLHLQIVSILYTYIHHQLIFNVTTHLD